MWVLDKKTSTPSENKYVFESIDCQYRVFAVILRLLLDENTNKEGILAFKCVKGQAPGYRISHTRNTRNKDMLNIPVYKSTAGRRTFPYRAVSLWNSLPRTLKDYLTSRF